MNFRPRPDIYWNSVVTKLHQGIYFNRYSTTQQHQSPHTNTKMHLNGIIRQ